MVIMSTQQAVWHKVLRGTPSAGVEDRQTYLVFLHTGTMVLAVGVNLVRDGMPLHTTHVR